MHIYMYFIQRFVRVFDKFAIIKFDTMIIHGIWLCLPASLTTECEHCLVSWTLYKQMCCSLDKVQYYVWWYQLAVGVHIFWMKKPKHLNGHSRACVKSITFQIQIVIWPKSRSSQCWIISETLPLLLASRKRACCVQELDYRGEWTGPCWQWRGWPWCQFKCYSFSSFLLLS